MELAGRSAECARLDRLLAAAQTGQSAVLVVRGDSGIGKTALLDYAAERGLGWRVVRAVGVEAEMELPFAGLHQLCAALLERLERLPQPQHEALASAFGLSAAARPDRFLIGLAVLSLLSDAAEETPLLCLIDDAQWLDRSSAQVLAFVSRRLQVEPVVILFAEREPGGLDELVRLPEMRLQGLSDRSSRELLASVVSGPLDERVYGRLLAEARGNPLALLELPREYLLATFAGGFERPDDLPLPGRIEAGYRRRVGQLPAATQQLLLAAAAEPTGDPMLLWRSAMELGIPPAALAPAEADGLLEVGVRVAFRHPLLRSAIYRGAPAEQRRDAHRALAAATDGEVDPDRRAWHRANATLVPDEDVASELESSAARGQARGGLASAAALLQHAAALTPDPRRRASRALNAARAKQLSGSPQAALALISAAAAGPLDGRDHAMSLRLEGQIALDMRRAGEALPLLLDAAGRLASLDPDLARETHLEALRAALIGGRLGGGVREPAKAARRLQPRSGTPRGVDLLLDGLAIRFTDGYAAGAPLLKQALAAVEQEGGGVGQDARWPLLARRVAPDLFDDDTWEALATRGVRIVRQAGALGVLPLALNNLATVRTIQGDLDSAEVLLEEADAIADATGTARIVFGRVSLAGYRGDEARASRLIGESEPAAVARGEGVVLTSSEHARSVLHNGLGQYEAALLCAESAGAQDELALPNLSLAELVEAATGSGRTEVATSALEALSERTRAAGTEWSLGIEARCRALLSEGENAEQLYHQAIQRLGRTRMRVELARAHLVFGEWLRRERRRTDAREHLRTAHQMLVGMGVGAFAERARRELSATGDTTGGRAAEARDELTAQELQIARLAGDGRTNPEIGAELFISPRTVEWHLGKVFAKLGVTSRRAVGGALGTRADPGSRA
jgi:DNA-binding CsgD family transcriptional regulator